MDMDHEDAFVQAVVEDPDDDAPRLVFADWLDDHGEADRAALIRTQCALAKIDQHDPRRSELERREDDLLAEHGAKWVKAEVPLAFRRANRFRRGFAEHTSGKAETFVARRTHLAALPASSVRLARSHPDDLRAFGTLPWPGLRNLHLYDFRSESLPVLLDAPYLPELRKLRFSGWSQSLSVPAVAALLDSPAAAFTHLDLDSFCLHDRDVRMLLASPTAARLEYLRLDVLLDRDVPTLADTDRLPRLRHFDVDDDVLLTDSALRALAASPRSLRLRKLNLGRLSNLTDDGYRALAASPHLANLADLVVSGNGLTDDGVRALVESPHLRSLVRLEVSATSGTKVSRKWPFWKPRRAKKHRVLWTRDVR